MDVPSELLDCLEKISKNPFTRLTHDIEQQLVSAGLIRRWMGFISITQAGRAALAGREADPPP